MSGSTAGGLGPRGPLDIASGHHPVGRSRRGKQTKSKAIFGKVAGPEGGVTKPKTQRLEKTAKQVAERKRERLKGEGLPFRPSIHQMEIEDFDTLALLRSSDDMEVIEDFLEDLMQVEDIDMEDIPDFLDLTDTIELPDATDDIVFHPLFDIEMAEAPEENIPTPTIEMAEAPAEEIPPAFIPTTAPPSDISHAQPLIHVEAPVEAPPITLAPGAKRATELPPLARPAPAPAPKIVIPPIKPTPTAQVRPPSPAATAPKPTSPLLEPQMDRVKKLIDQGKYKEAYAQLLPLARANPTHEPSLVNMAFCLEKLGRYHESLALYRKLLKDHPKDNTCLERVADNLCHTKDIIRAKILYSRLLAKDPPNANEIQQKIDACSQALRRDRSREEWPSYGELCQAIGIDSMTPVTPAQLHAIDSMHGRLLSKQPLIWELFMKDTDRLSQAFVQQHFQPVTLQSADGRTFTAYRNPHFRFLAHFSSLANSKRILDNEIAATQDPAVRESPDYFWNCQYKICASLLREGESSFYGVYAFQKGLEGLGFIIDVPDPERNVLHAFCRDNCTPTFVKSSQAQSITSKSDEDLAKNYNDFMLRYEVLSEYVCAIHQQATREMESLLILDRLHRLESIVAQNGDSIISHLIKSCMRYVASWFTTPDPNLKIASSLFTKLKAAVASAYPSAGDEASILSIMKEIDDHLDKAKESGQTTQLKEEIENTERSFRASITPFREPVTSPKDFRTGQPLIVTYLDSTIEELRPILTRSPELESTLAARILRHPLPQGETLIGYLENMRDSVYRFCVRSYQKVTKKHLINPNSPWDLDVFCHPLTPNEVMRTTRKNSYNEVGVRSNPASHEVGVRGANFRGVVVEQAFVSANKISSEMASVLATAERAKLPIIFI